MESQHPAFPPPLDAYGVGSAYVADIPPRAAQVFDMDYLLPTFGQIWVTNWFVVHGWVSKDILVKSLVPMLKVSAFERTGSRVAGGVVIAVDVAPALEVTSAAHVSAVAAGASAFIVLVVLIR